jgi:hypothetical protein
MYHQASLDFVYPEYPGGLRLSKEIDGGYEDKIAD